MVTESIAPSAGITPGTKFDRKNYEVIAHTGNVTVSSLGVVEVSVPKNPTGGGTYVTAPLWPKCSAYQENEPQGPFSLENITNTGFTIRGEAGMKICWECRMLGKIVTHYSLMYPH